MNNELRNYHLTFCKICKMRALNIDHGIICSKTNTIANFNKDCPDFVIDKLELDKIKEKVKSKIESYNTNETISFIFGTYHFIKKEKINDRKNFKSKHSTLNISYNQNDNRLVIFSVCSILSLLLILLFFIQNFNQNFILMFFVVILIGSILYIIESHKEFKIIKITEDYFQYGNMKICWREILDYGIIRKIQKGGDLYILELFTMNHGNLKIILNDYDYLSYEKIVEILNFNKSELSN